MTAHSLRALCAIALTWTCAIAGLALPALASADPSSSAVRPLQAATVSAGTGHSCVTLESNELSCFGIGAVGQLGYGTVSNVGATNTPDSVGAVPAAESVRGVSTGDGFTCALGTTGAVRCWGSANGEGRLGTPGVLSQSLASSAAPIDLGGRATQIDSGENHTCALLEGGAVRCWGRGTEGQLGYGSVASIGDNETPASVGDVPIGGTAVGIATGYFHSCALLDTGAVRCWGSGFGGKLGYGSADNVGDHPSRPISNDVSLGGPASAITASWEHTCAIMVSGGIKCWGTGTFGRLGYGNTTTIGDDELPSAVGVVSLGVGQVPIAVSAGELYTCALLATGGVRCWGAGGVGQLGTASTANVGDDELPSAAATASLTARAVALDAGDQHTCAILITRAVQCWGVNTNGKLGYGTVAGSMNIVGDDEVPSSVGVVPTGGASVAKVSDLETSASSTSALLALGGQTTTTVTIVNDGPDTAALSASIRVSGHTEVTSAVPSSGAFDAASGVWHALQLGSGASANLVINHTAVHPGWGGVDVFVSPSGTVDPDEWLIGRAAAPVVTAGVRVSGISGPAGSVGTVGPAGPPGPTGLTGPVGQTGVTPVLAVFAVPSVGAVRAKHFRAAYVATSRTPLSLEVFRGRTRVSRAVVRPTKVGRNFVRIKAPAKVGRYSVRLVHAGRRLDQFTMVVRAPARR